MATSRLRSVRAGNDAERGGEAAFFDVRVGGREDLAVRDVDPVVGHQDVVTRDHVRERPRTALNGSASST
jgi:hypothetical protein